MVWKLLIYMERKEKMSRMSAVLQIAETLRWRPTCAKLEKLTKQHKIMNVSYNKITKLIIPQKTSENMDNLQIDLFSNTLPVDWNEKNVGIQVIIGQFSTLKISLTSRYVHHFSCDDESVCILNAKGLGRASFLWFWAGDWVWRCVITIATSVW